MTVPCASTPVSVTIRDDHRQALNKLRILADSGATLRRSVKSITVKITEGEDHMGLGLLSDFLDIYPNLRELDLSGFDCLTGCTPEFEIDRRRTRGRDILPTPEESVFSLRNLRLEARRSEPHSLRVLFEQTSRMPELSELQIAKFTFQTGSNNLEVDPVRLPCELEMYAFISEHPMEARGWTAPLVTSSSGGAPPKSLIIQFDTRGLEELYHPGVDLSHLHSLALFAFGSPSASLSDFGAVVGCCSRLKDLHISTYQRALPTELFSLLSNVSGSLRCLALVTFPHDFATFVAGGADTAFAEAAGLPQMRDIRQLNVTIVDFLGTGLPPQSFPLLTASCRARRIRLICRAQDPAGLA